VTIILHVIDIVIPTIYMPWSDVENSFVMQIIIMGVTAYISGGKLVQWMSSKAQFMSARQQLLAILNQRFLINFMMV